MQNIMPCYQEEFIFSEHIEIEIEMYIFFHQISTISKTKNVNFVFFSSSVEEFGRSPLNDGS